MARKKAVRGGVHFAGRLVGELWESDSGGIRPAKYPKGRRGS
jgi:hypothetical protein